MQFPSDHYASAKFWLDVADKSIKVLALVVGGIWTYLNYRRGRTFEKRLELETSGRFFWRDRNCFLVATCKVKNIGLSKLPVQHRGTGCEVFPLTTAAPNPAADEDPAYLLSIFEEHDWIEPAESLFCSEVVSMDDHLQGLIGVRLTMRFVSSGIDWHSSAIVELTLPETERPIESSNLASDRRSHDS